MPAGSVIVKTLPDCKVIFLQSTLQVDSGKAALTLHYLNEYFSQLNYVIVDNSCIKVKHIRQKILHLNPNGKTSLALKFIRVF